MSEFETSGMNPQDDPSGQNGTNQAGQDYVFDPYRYSDPSEGITPPSPPENKPPKKSKKGLWSAILVVSVVLICAGVFVGINSASMNKPKEDPQKTTENDIVLQDKPEEKPLTPTQGEKLTTEQVAEKVTPSVVGILCYSSYDSIDPSTAGSGIIMSSDGYIATNAHVVKNAVGISVRLEDGTEKKAQLIGIDTKTDLAVIKIEGDNYAYAEFGNSDQLVVGESVVAIGNPGGMTLYGSTTHGIVSGLNRALDPADVYSLNLIQTDAPINPGNSGGALVNMYGQVVGINTLKIVEEGFEGLGFAIAINDAKPILEALIRDGYVRDRVRLGVTVTEINETLAEMNSVSTGLYIRQIEPNGSMADSGAHVGDIITHVNGERVETYEQLQKLLMNHKPGDQVVITLLRRVSAGNNKTLDVTAVLQEDESGRPAQSTK